jgi:hypothetical protein
MITQEYNKQYVTLKAKIRKIKTALILRGINDATLKFIEHLNALATELDIKYSDEKPLDTLENSIEILDKTKA